MADPSSIITVIATIKNSIDIAKAVKDANSDFNQAILKEKIAVLVDSLLEVKLQANETLELIQEKDKRITELEELLKFKNKLVRKDGMYFEADENEKQLGEPYCPHCWEAEQKPIHLIKVEDNYFRCVNCKNFIGKSEQSSSYSG